jgi:uncharacterized protein (TIGR03435 family)
MRPLAWFLSACVTVITVPGHAQQGPQPQTPSRTFEVASVKPHDPANPRSMMVADLSGRFTAVNIPVVMLIRTAYGLQNDQVAGGPAWLRSEGFDITAKAEDGTPVTALGPPLQALLADRFQLTMHSETRDLPIYALVKARADGNPGPRLTPNPCVWDFTKPPAPAAPGAPRCGNISEGFGRMLLNAVPMSAFLQYLAPKVNRVIVDRSGLSGNFDIELQWTPEQLPPRAPGTPADQPIRVNGVDIDPNGPSLFTALQEQLGLKLESSRGPVNVMVIDRVERPAPD